MIDFKTPVLAKLKELAETNDHPVFMVVVKDGTSYIDLYRKCNHGDGYPYYLKGITPKAAPEVSAWAAMAHILGIFDDVVQAAVDSTVPPSLKTKVIARLKELVRKKGEEAHPVYAVVETLNICGESMQFRLITWKSSWDLLLDMNPGSGIEVDCRKPDSDPQWGQVASMLGMLSAADNQL